MNELPTRRAADARHDACAGSPRPSHRLAAALGGLCLAFVLAFVGASPAFALEPEQVFDDPVKQQRYEQLNDNLRCLVCQNQAIADSNAGLAQDLRREVREMISAGSTDAEIRDFMTERYGDFVLYSPPVTARTYLLWAAPVILLLIGLGSVALNVAQRSRMPIDTDSEEAT